MFTKTAQFYDAIYSFKDYRKESEILTGVIGKDGGSLLDVACGTGKHLEFLSEQFECEGLDLDPNLLDIARQRLPAIQFHLGDMTGFDLGKRFDVVTCLFSAIGYAETPVKLNNALGCFANHLNSGGILIVEPWLDPSIWKPGTPHALFVDEPDLKIARMSETSTDGRVSVVRFEYLINTPAGIISESEVHRLGLFTRDEYIDAIRQAGLEAEFIEDETLTRGLYVGRA